MKLTLNENKFITEYLRNGGNGTQAYLAIRPGMSRNAAAACASRLLKRPAVEEALQVVVDKNIASREHLIEEAHDVKERAKREGKSQVELNAIYLKGKLAGVYQDRRDDTSQFDKIIAACTVNNTQINVNVENKDSEEAIDVTPEIEDTED